MRNVPFSSVSEKERFWTNVAITIIIITSVLLSAVFAWLTFQEKVQISETSKQQTTPTATPSNAWDGVDLTATLNTGNNASTNMLTPLPPHFISVTNSN